MTSGDRHAQVEAGRRRAELTVSDLWLRYVGLGGNGDLFDVDAYLNGLVPLDSLDQDMLAVAVNERLAELYAEARVPLATQAPVSPAELRNVIADLLDSPGSRTAHDDESGGAA